MEVFGLVITDTGHEAFKGMTLAECLRIAKGCLENIPEDAGHFREKLYDINGNPVGYVEFTEE